MVPKSLSCTAIDGASYLQFLGSQEHRVQVSRAIISSLLRRNMKYQSLNAEQTIRHQTSQDSWKKPARDILLEASADPKAEQNNSQLYMNGGSLLPSVELQPSQAAQSQSHISQDNIENTQTLLSPLSPPPSHSQVPRSLHSSNFECGQRNTWSSPPHTPPSPSPTLPRCSLSPAQLIRQKHRVINPVTPEMHNLCKPLYGDVERNPVPEYPLGADTDEMVSLINGEIALYEIRERYEESVGRALLARYNAMVCRQQKEALIVKSRIEGRRKGDEERGAKEMRD